MENNEPKQVHGMTESSYAGLMNLIFLVPSCGWIISIVLWAIGKDQSEFINQSGKSLINWMISCIIYAVLLSLFLVFGALKSTEITVIIVAALFVIFGLFVLICPIVAGVKAINNENWKYPLTISFLK